MTNFFQISPSLHRQSIRLFCVPHAGVGASAFRGWKERLEPDVEVVIVQLPGREARFRDKPYRDLETLTRELAAAVLPHVTEGQKFAFFGNSLGGLISFETLHEIRRRSGLQAVHLFVSAAGAPQLDPLLPPIGHLADRELIREVSERYGGIPSVVLEDEEFLAVVVASLRADLLMLEGYERRNPDALACPITAFGGQHDRTIPREHIDRWSEQTTASFTPILLDEEHLYLQSARDELIAHIRGSLCAAPLAR